MALQEEVKTVNSQGIMNKAMRTVGIKVWQIGKRTINGGKETEIEKDRGDSSAALWIQMRSRYCTLRRAQRLAGTRVLPPPPAPPSPTGEGRELSSAPVPADHNPPPPSTSRKPAGRVQRRVGTIRNVPPLRWGGGIEIMP